MTSIAEKDSCLCEVLFSRMQPVLVVMTNLYTCLFSSTVINLQTNRCVRTIGKVRITSLARMYLMIEDGLIQFLLVKNGIKFWIYTQQCDCMLGLSALTCMEFNTLSFQMENVRFVQLALHQGKTKKSKAAVTLVNAMPCYY